ncbi:hypothetical protein D3C81_1051360 [compost metagenome]
MFCPALLQWPGRFTFEIDEVGIALHHQHLAQVQVAVHAHQQAALGLAGQVGDVLGQAVALLLQVVYQRLAFAVEAVAVLGQQVEGMGEFGADLRTPAFAVVGIAWARLKGLVIGRCGQQQVHLAQALAEQGGKAGEFGQCIGVRIGVEAGRLHLVADGPFQGVLGPGPGVTLVAQVALGDHQQVWRALLIHPADPGQQRRNIGKACGGQVGTHFQLGVHTRVDPANQLEHHLVADHHRAVGLLGAEVAHAAFVVQRQARQLLRACEAQLALAVATRQMHAALTGTQHRADEWLEDEGVGDQANLMGTAHPRQGQLLR